jgi:hypothetical protein
MGIALPFTVIFQQLPLTISGVSTTEIAYYQGNASSYVLLGANQLYNMKPLKKTHNLVTYKHVGLFRRLVHITPEGNTQANLQIV